ncbi:carbohydrate ABC transporter permease [Clostridium beijerinckii]|uniref:carbohydrate ABC transporter permease n=1 Tax=Clostridium beijerinckii TaxID=1520 RepID=UPI00156DA57D|nr:carbohydrate ABC transporter permease [Clostridium beijerinckii]NRT72009.1 multiple sugar transport system permease protein [Clostridium beijerinckii]
MNMKWRKRIFGKALPYGILSLIGICFFLPLLWVIVASFDSNASQALQVPKNITLDNYINVLKNEVNQRSFIIGLLISVLQTVFVVIVAGLCAYPLSRYQMKQKKLFMYSILFMTSLPITALMVPVYQLFITINLYDNIFGVILFLTASALPYAIWMMKNFMDSVPLELEEAAWVDGASVFAAIRKVITPVMLPGIFTVAIYTFSGSWGNFFVPYILISSAEKYPASVMLYQFFGNHGMIAYGPLAAYSVLYAAPSILLYIISQKYMSKGFSMQGAAKG